MKIDRRENIKFIVQITRIDLHHKLQLLNRICFFFVFFFGLSSVISKVSVADFENLLVCWKRYSTKTIVALILKYLAQQTNTYSKSVAETLKQEVKSVKS